MTTYQITFSPTGGTRRVCDLISSGIGNATVARELCEQRYDSTPIAMSEGDIAVIGMPVYGGRVPSEAVTRLRNVLRGPGMCAIVGVYGNRHYDDALVEMQDIAAEMGLRVMAAVTAVAEHSIARCYGTGRPDASDADELTRMGKEIRAAAERDGQLSEQLSLPGNRPYKTAGQGPKPTAGEECDACGACAKACPVSAIDPEQPKTSPSDACIGCMKCVATCPKGARGIGALLNAVTERLRPVCEGRKGNELLIMK